MPNNRKKQEAPKLSVLLQAIRKIFTLNIGTLIFGTLLIYMLFSAVLYITSGQVSSYQVISGPLSRNETYTGLVLREDSVVQAQNGGYITYYAREGNKMNAQGPVYGLSSSQSSQSTGELSTENLAQIQNQMSNFSYNFNPSNFNDVYNFKYELRGNLLHYSEETTSPSSSSSDTQNNEVGVDTKEKEKDTTPIVSYTSSGQTIYRAPSAGIILYSKDGYEGKTADTLTAQDFNENSYERTDLKSNGQIEAGDDVYSIITNESWSLIIPLSENQAVKLADRTSIRVKFLKDSMTQVGNFSIIEIEGEKYGKIDFSKGLIRYSADRFLDIELVTNSQSGLKIPLSSIVTKEFYLIPVEYASKDSDTGEIGFLKEGKNGKKEFVSPTIYAGGENTETNLQEGMYYVEKTEFKEGDAIVKGDSSGRYIIGETGVLEGVYSINRGYAVFRRIEIIDQNDEYAIVKNDTAYGLARYDHIVQDADKVNEEEILY